MSTIVVSGHHFADLTTADLTGVWAESAPVSHDDTSAEISTSDGNYILAGTGLGGYDAHGYPTTGTVTGFTFVGPNFTVAVSDFTFDAHDLRQIFRYAHTGDFYDFLFSDDNDITLNAGGTRLFTGDGDDHVTGGKSSDHIAGQDGSDTISGGKGGDFIGGGRGADTLTGGMDADTFAYAASSDSKKGGVDTITDLHDEDTIDLSAIDADTVAPGEQGFFLAASHTGVPGELVLTYDAVHNRTIIKGYTDTDDKADLIIYASGDHALYSNFDF